MKNFNTKTQRHRDTKVDYLAKDTVKYYISPLITVLTPHWDPIEGVYLPTILSHNTSTS
jgi:hypothetical protein